MTLFFFAMPLFIPIFPLNAGKRWRRYLLGVV